MSSTHYDIQLDIEDVASAHSASLLVEWYHARLEKLFGSPLNRKLPLLVCTDGDRYAELARSLGAWFETHAYYVAGRLVIVNLENKQGVFYLAHELVHHFTHELGHPLPAWFDEGLASEIAHDLPLVSTRFEGNGDLRYLVRKAREGACVARASRRTVEAECFERLATALALDLANARELAEKIDRSGLAVAVRCPVIRARALSDSEIRSAISEFPSNRTFYGSEQLGRNSDVATAVVRWAIETHPQWRSLAEVEAVVPDVEAVIAWLRSDLDAAKMHEQFSPITVQGP